MPRISRIPPEQAAPELAPIYADIQARRGNIPQMFRAMAHRPEILQTFFEHLQAVMETGLIEKNLKELLVVRVSQLNECSYCLDSHVAKAKGLGWSDKQIAGSNAGLSLREIAALRLAETMTRDSNSVSDADWEQVRKHFSEAEVVELLVVIGLFNYINRFNNVLQMEPSR